MDDYARFAATRYAEHGLELAIGGRDAAMISAWERRKLSDLIRGNPDSDLEEDPSSSVGFSL